VLAKQVLSQLSYTPIVKATLILKHLPLFRIPILRKIVIAVPELMCQIAFSSHLFRSYFCKASLFFCEYFLNT
jgi:hypothetical protein